MVILQSMNPETPVAPAIIPSQKIYYLDHVKVLLTVLVILHHSFITYGGPGGWYYRQPTTSQAALIPMTMFVSTNQAFFMGLFKAAWDTAGILFTDIFAHIELYDLQVRR